MNNKYVNRAALEIVANALGTLSDEATYVGGVVVGMYVEDTYSEEPRPTEDIDIFLEIYTPTQLERVRELLAAKGFHPDHTTNVMCRFFYKGITVDVMSTTQVGWAPANKWYALGLKHAQRVKLNDTISIQILSLPYYLATKFEAFHDRGAKEPRTSKDMEDIVYLLNNNRTWEIAISESPTDVKEYIVAELKALAEPKNRETLRCHLTIPHHDQLIIERINSLR